MKNKHQINRDIHEHLEGEYRWNHTGQISLIILFSIVLILDLFLIHSSIWLQNFIPLLIRTIIAVPILVLSYFLLRSSIKTIFEQEHLEQKIIKSGIYSRVRHPIYLAPIIMYLGIIILSLSIISFFIWLFIITFYYSMARYEEALLIKKFGNEYKNYMKDVPMFIPRIIT